MYVEPLTLNFVKSALSATISLLMPLKFWSVHSCYRAWTIATVFLRERLLIFLTNCRRYRTAQPGLCADRPGVITCSRYSNLCIGYLFPLELNTNSQLSVLLQFLVLLLLTFPMFSIYTLLLANSAHLLMLVNFVFLLQRLSRMVNAPLLFKALLSGIIYPFMSVTLNLSLSNHPSKLFFFVRHTGISIRFGCFACLNFLRMNLCMRIVRCIGVCCVQVMSFILFCYQCDVCNCSNCIMFSLSLPFREKL